VRLLINKGADVKAKITSSDLTALHFAAVYGHVAVSQLLAEEGVALEAKSTSGSPGFPGGLTALHMAVASGHVEVVRLLVRMGAALEVKSTSEFQGLPSGLTALHIAVVNKNEALVGLLLENGADAKAKPARRETALHLAVSRGNAVIVRCW
jgi:ankyrin repeat protein